MSDFSFNAHIAAMGDPDKLLSNGDIFFHRKRRTVEHDRCASAMDGLDAARKAVAVIQMQAHRDRSPLAAV